MRIADDLTYADVGVVQPEGGAKVGELEWDTLRWAPGNAMRKLPQSKHFAAVRLIDKDCGEVFRFSSQAQYRD